MRTTWISYAWYALQVRTRCEQFVAGLLQAKGYEQFLPTIRSIEQRATSNRAVQQPLYPGYLFYKHDPRIEGPVVTTPFVIRVVGFCDRPVPICDSEIENIRSLVSCDLNIHPWPFLSCGQRVQMVSGPLRGVKGTLLFSKSCTRLVVSVDLLQRACAVEVKREWVNACLDFAA